MFLGLEVELMSQMEASQSRFQERSLNIGRSKCLNYTKLKILSPIFLDFFIEPEGVKDLKVDLIPDNNVEVRCAGPDKLNGPKGEYLLVVKEGGEQVKTESKKNCHFSVANLRYSTNYSFEVRK